MGKSLPSNFMKMNSFMLSWIFSPINFGHTLVIPKAHTTGLLDPDEATLGELIARVKKVAARVKAALPCDGFNILQNNGAAAGQTVNHLHFHIVPRRSGDALAFENAPGDMAALAQLAERLRFS